MGVFTETPPPTAVYLRTDLLHDCRMQVFIKYLAVFYLQTLSNLDSHWWPSTSPTELLGIPTILSYKSVIN